MSFLQEHEGVRCLQSGLQDVERGPRFAAPGCVAHQADCCSWVRMRVIHHWCGTGQASCSGSADIRRQTGVTLVALYRQKADGNIVPNASTRLEAKDELIILGTRDQLAALQALTNPSRE